MVLDGGWLAIVKVSTYTPVLHLLGWGHIDSLTHQVLYDCHIHKKLFNLLDFLKISLHFINMINGKLEYILSQLFLSIHSQRLHAIIKFNTCVFYFLFK